MSSDNAQTADHLAGTKSPIPFVYIIVLSDFTSLAVWCVSCPLANIEEYFMRIVMTDLYA